MKISELARRTGVSKETIHHYIREGLLRKPRKTGKKAVDYGEVYVRQIRLVKELRDNYFLPLPIIKKILKEQKKQTPSEQSSFQLQSEYLRPIERFFPDEVIGKDAFQEATGLGRYWLDKMEEWGIISARLKNGEPVYSHENVIIGRLMVDMDRLGFGPQDGYDPKGLKPISDFIQRYLTVSTREYLERNAEKLNSPDFQEKGSQFIELMSLFLYHFYRKIAKEATWTHG
ncbi:MAG: MerR family transcriptional regulator [Deltaproteobacteria bacterium]|jgi:DNA-binding transcriptional MerR regulator|nr:MerR family transcriptional regulator [Deltaproteobacteria bacterium]